MPPSNPMTISDQRPQANTWNDQTVRDRYAGRPLFVEELQADLRELRSWDSFTGSTDPGRELAKAELKTLLDIATGNVNAGEK